MNVRKVYATNAPDARRKTQAVVESPALVALRTLRVVLDEKDASGN